MTNGWKKKEGKKKKPSIKGHHANKVQKGGPRGDRRNRIMAVPALPSSIGCMSLLIEFVFWQITIHMYRMCVVRIRQIPSAPLFSPSQPTRQSSCMVGREGSKARRWELHINSMRKYEHTQVLFPMCWPPAHLAPSASVHARLLIRHVARDGSGTFVI